MVKELSKRTSFNVRAWASNVPGSHKFVSDNDLNNIPSQKVLGMTWQTETGKLELSFYKDIRPNGKKTKRSISPIVMEKSFT